MTPSSPESYNLTTGSVEPACSRTIPSPSFIDLTRSVASKAVVPFPIPTAPDPDIEVFTPPAFAIWIAYAEVFALSWITFNAGWSPSWSLILTSGSLVAAAFLFLDVRNPYPPSWSTTTWIPSLHVAYSACPSESIHSARSPVSSWSIFIPWWFSEDPALTNSFAVLLEFAPIATVDSAPSTLITSVAVPPSLILKMISSFWAWFWINMFSLASYSITA